MARKVEEKNWKLYCLHFPCFKPPHANRHATAKPGVPTDGTRIDVTMRTQPLDQNRSTQGRNLPKPSMTSQAFNRTENAGTIFLATALLSYGTHKTTSCPIFITPPTAAERSEVQPRRGDAAWPC